MNSTFEGDLSFGGGGDLSQTSTSLISDSADVTKRRSSNRSIKRKKFDDELVEYSHVIEMRHDRKHSRARTTSSHVDLGSLVSSPVGTTQTTLTSTTLPSIVQPPLVATPTQPLNAQLSTMVIVEDKLKRKSAGKPSATVASSVVVGGGAGSSKNRKKGGRQQNQIATKDLGRWKPMDDLALIIGVQQTNDMRTVHLGTKFSCRFTVQELQQRWYALLYDQAVSRIAVAAMRNLHPDMVAAVQDRALWSSQEEQLLVTVKSQSNPTLKVFIDLLAINPDVFYPSRTANALQRHWNTMRLYHLLPDQVIHPLPTVARPIMTISEAEDLIQDTELTDSPTGCEHLDREMRLQHRRNAREIRQLENEVGRWNVLVDSVTGVCPGELDGQTLAVLRGRMVRYLMRSREITVGRAARGNPVDVDLGLEGPAHKVSRRQATLRLRNTGEFYLSAEGKRPIFIDGRPITTGNKARLYDNSVVEMASLRFIFSVNQDLIRVIHNESVSYNLPP